MQIPLAIEAENIGTEAPAAAAFIKSKLEAIFGERYKVKANYSHSLGHALHLRFIDAAPANNIDHNSPVFCQFMMWLSPDDSIYTAHRGTSSKGRTWVSWEASQLPRGVKFRKITSKKSIQEASEKLVQWFEKNRENFEAILANRTF